MNKAQEIIKLTEVMKDNPTFPGFKVIKTPEGGAVKHILQHLGNVFQIRVYDHPRSRAGKIGIVYIDDNLVKSIIKDKESPLPPRWEKFSSTTIPDVRYTPQYKNALVFIKRNAENIDKLALAVAKLDKLWFYAK